MEHNKLNSTHLPFWYKLNIDDHSNVLLKYHELLILFISCQVVVWRSLGIVCRVSGVPWCWLWSCRFVDSWLFFGRLLVCTQVSCLSVFLQSIRILLEGCLVVGSRSVVCLLGCSHQAFVGGLLGGCSVVNWLSLGSRQGVVRCFIVFGRSFVCQVVIRLMSLLWPVPDVVRLLCRLY